MVTPFSLYSLNNFLASSSRKNEVTATSGIIFLFSSVKYRKGKCLPLEWVSKVDMYLLSKDRVSKDSRVFANQLDSNTSVSNNTSISTIIACKCCIHILSISIIIYSTICIFALMYEEITKMNITTKTTIINIICSV